MPKDIAVFPGGATLWWGWVLELSLKAKDRDLAAGLDKDGKPLRPISAATRKHRVSAMTPSGKGDPSAPPLEPGRQKSRTRSLLTGRAFPDHAEFWWKFDPWTGDSWAAILRYQAQEGRDVFGLSPEGLARVEKQALERWRKWVAGKPVAAPVVPLPTEAPMVIQPIGRMDLRLATLGIGGPGRAAMEAGQRRGGMTLDELERHLRAPARAVIPGRPRGEYNVLLRQIWGPGPLPGTPPKMAPIVKVPPKPKPIVKVAMGPMPIVKPKPKPQPIPVLPGPAGIPVRDALADRTKGKTSKAVQDSLAAIAKIHGDGNLPKIPIEQSAGTRVMGQFRRYAMTNQPINILISGRAEQPRITTLHEIGHFIEWSGIPKMQGGSRIFSLTPGLKEWLEATKNSQAVKDLRQLRAVVVTPMLKPDGTMGSYKVDRRYIGYLLQDDELWARAYAQYIATKSGDPTMMKELDESRGPGKLYPSQWSDADFAPIMKLMDDLFIKLGWIK